jgi:hypothetical protein
MAWCEDNRRPHLTRPAATRQIAAYPKRPTVDPNKPSPRPAPSAPRSRADRAYHRKKLHIITKRHRQCEKCGLARVCCDQNGL